MKRPQMKSKSQSKILVIEDEALLNEAYTMILKKEGFNVDSVFNGSEALDHIKKSVPDLILLDLRMPKMNGVEFLEKLGAKKNYPKMKIIVFSNFDVQKEIDMAYSLGASRYVLKAWASPKELVKVVKSNLET